MEHRASSSGSGEGASRFNPWDDRLANEPQLGSRILEVLSCIKGPRAIHSLDANASVKEVVMQALDIVQPALQKHFQPQEYFKSNPLSWWLHMSQQLHLCDRFGKRSHHALWNLQVAYNNINNNTKGAAGGPPILKTVGLDRIDSNCIYYWTADSAFPSSSSSSDPTTGTCASVLWMGGEYPTEGQWRAEGFLFRVTLEECALRGFAAPPSLIAHVTAGCECEGDKDSYQRTSRTSRLIRMMTWYRMLVNNNRTLPMFVWYGFCLSALRCCEEVQVLVSLDILNVGNGLEEIQVQENGAFAPYCPFLSLYLPPCCKQQLHFVT